jgi:hypothetical protein
VLEVQPPSGCPVTYDEIKDKTKRTCFACQLGRMHVFPRLAVTEKDYAPLECMAVDYKGPISTPTIHRCIGFCLISDQDQCRMKLLLCQHERESAAHNSTAFLYPDGTALQIHLKAFALRLRLCGPGRRRERLYFQSITELQTSAPYSHHQNGQIERAMQTTLDKTRTLSDYYALQTDTYLIMRSPNSTNASRPTRS